MKTYAGIGSRETPPTVLNHMQKIATRLREQGYTLYSGGAPGADSAFEAGAGDSKVIFLPRKSFNGRKVDDVHYFKYTSEAVDIAAQFHPLWTELSDAAQDFHARNVHQVLGLDLKSPVEFVVCWTWPNAMGGTGQAIRIANHYNIPVFNLQVTTFPGGIIS
jgi:hypothetical protein